MTEFQEATTTIALYFDTLMLLAKVFCACILLDSVCFVVFGFAWFAGKMRRG